MYQQIATSMDNHTIGTLHISKNEDGVNQVSNIEGIYTPSKTHRKSRYAIFTLMAGINPYESQSVKNYVSYLGYLIHLAAVRFMLDKSHSMMDFNILLRLQHGLPNNTLPEAQIHFFSKLKMNIIFLPQKAEGSWKSFTMEKFHILRFHEYKWIFFIDADVNPCAMGWQ
jgi:hypothetical protein